MDRIDRIRSLLKERGQKSKWLCEKLGVAESYLSDVKRGKNTLTNDRLAIIADILDTTPEYLRGETDRKEKTPAEPASVRSDIAEFMEKVSQLPPDAVSRLNDLADLILSARDGKK